MEQIITDEQSMIHFGKKFAQTLNGGDIILLKGDLGAGKTTFTKGIAQGFGIEDDVVSPTFTLMNIYNIQHPTSDIRHLIHIDTYRLENEDQLIEIGIEDYMGQSDTVTIIEWPEKLHIVLHDKKIKYITITHTDDNGRIIDI